ncbi:MAG: hypothetical protein J2O38_01735 [Acidimicrobiales bacterium]|nr:hypothetical protein [Acidimicrobiales bacterium]
MTLGTGSGQQRGVVFAQPGQAMTGLQPAVAPAGALSSSWYCAGATGPKGAAPASLLLANLGRRVVRGHVSVVSTGGPASTKTVVVQPRSSLWVPEGSGASGSYVAATAVLYGGQVAVWQVLSGPAGRATVACSPAAAKQWYEASGSTAGDSQVELALYNPLAADAVADLSFATTHGPAQPGDFQGIVVPARRLVVVDVGQHVQQQAAVATTVTARFGELVVDQLSTSGSGKATTVAVTRGVAGTASRWYFPVGQSWAGSASSYQVLNPSSAMADVRVSMRLSSGVVAPFALSVPPLSALTLATGGQRRVPGGIPYSVTINTANGVGVVAERTEASSSGLVTSSLLGAPYSSRTWLVTAPAAGFLVLQDAGRSKAKAGVATLTDGKLRPVPGLGKVAVAAGHARTVSVPGTGQEVIVVQASRPLVAEWVTSDSGRALPAMAVAVPSP